MAEPRQVVGARAASENKKTKNNRNSAKVSLTVPGTGRHNNSISTLLHYAVIITGRRMYVFPYRCLADRNSKNPHEPPPARTVSSGTVGDRLASRFSGGSLHRSVNEYLGVRVVAMETVGYLCAFIPTYLIYYATLGPSTSQVIPDGMHRLADGSVSATVA